MLTWQVNGHGAYGEKGQKGEPAVIEPVSVLETSCCNVPWVSSHMAFLLLMTELITEV